MFVRYGTSYLPSPTSTTRPPEPSSMSGIAKWLVIRCVSTPLRTTPSVASSGCSHTVLPHSTKGSPPQTSFTRMSSRPWSLRMRSTRASDGLRVGVVAADGDALATGGRDALGRVLDRLRAVHRRAPGTRGAAAAVDGGAERSELDGDGAAAAARGTGDEGDPARERLVFDKA